MTDKRLSAKPHAHHLRVQRTARYFTLGGESGAPTSIWFVLHGYGQLAGEFVRYFADLADEQTLIVAPEAMNRFYLVPTDAAPAGERPVGATWMTREDRASEIADYVEYLDGLHEEITGADWTRPTVNVVGFSQGAATATRWVARGKARMDRLVLWGGGFPPEADLSAGHAAIRNLPLTIVLGTRDKYVDEDMLIAQQARLDGAGIPYDVIRYEGGHGISRSVFPKLRP